MKTNQHTILALITGIALLAFPVSAREPSVPDFSKGMPDVNLEKKEKANGDDIFKLKTALSSKQLTTTLTKFLGPGWGKRKLNREEMILAANKGRTSNAEVNLAVYENAKIPGVDIRVIHLKHKEENRASSVEIRVIREEGAFAQKENAPKSSQAEKVWTKAHNRWPLDREWKVPANQSLEIFRNDYEASEFKGHITRPNLYDWDYDGAYFKCGSEGYQVELHYKGTNSGKDYYRLKITYPENGAVRTIEKRLIYDGVGVEVFRDNKYRICIRPWTDKQLSEQDGADQPGTAPESKPEGDSKPKPESEARPQ